MTATAAPPTDRDRASFVADVVAALGAARAPTAAARAAAAHAGLQFDYPVRAHEKRRGWKRRGWIRVEDARANLFLHQTVDAASVAALAAATHAGLNATPPSLPHPPMTRLLANLAAGPPAASSADAVAAWDALAASAAARTLEVALIMDCVAAGELLAGCGVEERCEQAPAVEAPAVASPDRDDACGGASSESDYDTPLHRPKPAPRGTAPLDRSPLDWPATARALAALAAAAASSARRGTPTFATAGGNAALTGALAAARVHARGADLGPVAASLLAGVRDRAVVAPGCAGELLPGAWRALGVREGSAASAPSAGLRAAADLTAAVAAAWPPSAVAARRRLWEDAVAGLLPALAAALDAAGDEGGEAAATADAGGAALAEIIKAGAACRADVAAPLLATGAWRGVVRALLAAGGPPAGAVAAATAGAAASPGQLGAYLAQSPAAELSGVEPAEAAAVLAALVGRPAALASALDAAHAGLTAPDGHAAFNLLDAMRVACAVAPGAVAWGGGVDGAATRLESALQAAVDADAAVAVGDGDNVDASAPPRDPAAGWRRAARRAAAAARRAAAGGGAKRD